MLRAMPLPAARMIANARGAGAHVAPDAARAVRRGAAAVESGELSEIAAAEWYRAATIGAAAAARGGIERRNGLGLSRFRLSLVRSGTTEPCLSWSCRHRRTLHRFPLLGGITAMPV